MLEELGIIILAGGKSSRMGKDKALLHFGDNTLLEYIINKVKDFGFKEIILVTNKPEKHSIIKDIKITTDYYPGLGPLAGIHAGLKRSNFLYNFVIPCDMPFISIEVIKKLAKNMGDCKIVVPKKKEKYQPLVAIYHQGCIKFVELLLKRQERKVIKLYNLVKTCYIELEEDDDIFLNINTPEDFSMASKLINKGGETW